MKNQIKCELMKLSSKQRAKSSAWFFKTGPGDYGEGDVFIGVKVPDQRKVAKQFADASLADVQGLLRSPVHEERLTAIFLLVGQYKKATSDDVKEKIVDLYIKNKQYVNNWDIVDSSAGYILGNWLLERDRSMLFTLARSKNLWDRRIAIIATQGFIAHDDFTDTFQIAEMLLCDKEDLIHKAVGWMLREVGKRDKRAEEAFLNKHAHNMPRTMLRYAIEKFPEKQRKAYLAK